MIIISMIIIRNSDNDNNNDQYDSYDNNGSIDIREKSNNDEQQY